MMKPTVVNKLRILILVCQFCSVCSPSPQLGNALSLKDAMLCLRTRNHFFI